MTKSGKSYVYPTPPRKKEIEVYPNVDTNNEASTSIESVSYCDEPSSSIDPLKGYIFIDNEKVSVGIIGNNSNSTVLDSSKSYISEGY